MNEVTVIGLDLAKNVFQAHGASAGGDVVFRKRLRRAQVLAFFAGQPRCRVAMEACAGAHHWARAIGELGHEVRLMPPAFICNTSRPGQIFTIGWPVTGKGKNASSTAG